MEQAVATQDGGNVLESVILKGDISALSPVERVQYYKAVCDSIGLNPLTQPLAYMNLSGKMVLYAKKDATDQLRTKKGVSVIPNSLRTQRVDDVYVVTVDMMDKDGRTDSATGAVPIGNLKGDALANAMMKAETKAKRRCTLSLCGLGLLDESELDTIPHETRKSYLPSQETNTEQHPVSKQAPKPFRSPVTDLDEALAKAKTRAEAKEYWKAWNERGDIKKEEYQLGTDHYDIRYNELK